MDIIKYIIGLAFAVVFTPQEVAVKMICRFVIGG